MAAPQLGEAAAFPAVAGPEAERGPTRFALESGVNTQPERFFSAGNQRFLYPQYQAGPAPGPSAASTAVEEDDGLGPLPSGWERRVQPEGRVYFVNHKVCHLHFFLPLLKLTLKNIDPAFCKSQFLTTIRFVTVSSVPPKGIYSIQGDLQNILLRLFKCRPHAEAKTA